MGARPKAVGAIDARTAKSIAKVFMSCYRKGVNDARLHEDDEGMILEHIELTKDGEVFGFLENTNHSFLYWKNRLSEIAEETSCYRVINTYFEKLGGYRQNYLSVMAVLAQSFYNRGLKDYIDNPGGDHVAFNRPGELKVWWNGSKGKKFDNYRLRAYVQDLCAIRIENIKNGGNDVLKDSHYELFSTAFSFAIAAK